VNRLVEQLDVYRLERKITQQQLAEMLGVTFATVNRWFNGHTEPNRIQSFHIKKLMASKGKKK
jgi:transcriptional regulator with XRE-family HTH domain